MASVKQGDMMEISIEWDNEWDPIWQGHEDTDALKFLLAN